MVTAALCESCWKIMKPEGGFENPSYLYLLSEERVVMWTVPSNVKVVQLQNAKLKPPQVSSGKMLY